MTAARPPGWYDEPSGDAAQLRWWDGRAWTAVTRDRASFEPPPVPTAVLASSGPGLADLSGPADLLESGAPRPRPRRGLLLAGLAVAVVVLLFAVGLPSGGGPGDRLAETGPPTAVPTEPPPTTARPVSGRIVDQVAGLSYDVLAGDWREWDRDNFRGLSSTLGYYQVTQEDAPNGQTYWANVNSGPVNETTTTPGDLPATARKLVDILSDRYYPPHTRTRQLARALTVDGAPAYLLRYRAVFDPAAAAGYAAATEEVVVLVVDTGRERPSALYLSLPDTVNILWASIDPLLASVRIER